MPFLDVSTNTTTSPKKREKLLNDLVNLSTTHLGKSKDVTMARLSTDQTMVFKGTSEPSVFMTIRAIGLPPPSVRTDFVAAISALVDDVLDISSERVFVVFEDVPADRWGVRGQLVG